MSIFKNQGYLTITLDTGLDLSALGAANLKILVKKPDGTKTSYTASIVSVTKLQYTVSNTDLSAEGLWEFQAYCEIATKKAYGDIFRYSVSSNLE
jgi:hypothetical protein